MANQANMLKDSLSTPLQDNAVVDAVQIFAAIHAKQLLEGFSILESTESYLKIKKDGAVLHLLADHAIQIGMSKEKLSVKSEELVILCPTPALYPMAENFSLKFSNQHYIHFLLIPATWEQLNLQLQTALVLHGKIQNFGAQSDTIHQTNESIKYVLKVARELNGLRDTNKLLSLILAKAREICNADAGSIYVVHWDDKDPKKGSIHFKITQNETVKLNLQEFQVPINENSIVGNAVIYQTTINIEDLYRLDADREKNPYRAQHDRSWDDRIGYQCRSMLTVPMFDISNRVIGVIQLINRKRKGVANLLNGTFDHDVIPFDEEATEYAEIIAYQAGIALENALLTEEKEMMFKGFVHASVTAIEQRDPTTSGHSHRVAKLTLETAKIVDGVHTGPYAKTKFSEDQLKEIEYASLLHDFGKLGVREEVLVKSKKLYPMQKELLMERFDHARTAHELLFFRDLVEFNQNPERFPPGTSGAILKASRDETLSEVESYLEFILKCNEPTVLEQGGFERLKDIANAAFVSGSGKKKLLLLENELKALSVSRGSLTREEFAEIQSHVTHTYEFLRKIPWGTAFANIPQIAAKHHEKLDGTGYPTGAGEHEIPVQSRIMTIADIFDALTAADRPYKKSVPAPKALEIIEMEVKSGKVDAELFRIFIESKIFNCVL